MAKAQLTTADEWLRPKDVQRLFKISPGKFYQFVKDGAFPVSKPGLKGRAVFVRKGDVDRFFEQGYPKAT